jgi:uncharacterized protein (DUF1684 family)
LRKAPFSEVYIWKEDRMQIPPWKTNLERARASKDSFFAQHWQSPIPPQDRPRFKGLQYYPPDLSYRFELELHEHAERQAVRIAYTKGNEQDFLRWGEFRFKVGGKEQALQAYKSSPKEEMLFIPFKDATSGKETYGAGRYLDLEPERDRTAEGKWVIDFNQAYNPWCVYSEAYTCPFVPIENWLKVAILAGEKNYPSSEGL